MNTTIDAAATGFATSAAGTSSAAAAARADDGRGGAALSALVAGGDVEGLQDYVRAFPDRRDAVDDMLIASGRFAEVNLLAQGPATPGPGVVDVYIGGAGDDSYGHAVENYEAGLGYRDDPRRDSLYFNHGEGGAATERVQALLDRGYIVNLVGHSWGGSTILEVANNVDGRINMLVGVDPVPRGPSLLDSNRDRPDNVDQFIVIDDVSNDRTPVTAGDRVENVGFLVGGPRPQAYFSPDKQRIETDYGHENFSQMLEHRPLDGDGDSQPSVRDRLDHSYREYLRSLPAS